MDRFWSIKGRHIVHVLHTARIYLRYSSPVPFIPILCAFFTFSSIQYRVWYWYDADCMYSFQALWKVVTVFLFCVLRVYTAGVRSQYVSPGPVPHSTLCPFCRVWPSTSQYAMPGVRARCPSFKRMCGCVSCEGYLSWDVNTFWITC